MTLTDLASSVKSIILLVVILIAFVTAVFLAGAKWQFQKDANRPVVTSYRYIEFTPTIVPKTETKPGMIDTSVNPLIESLLARLKRSTEEKDSAISEVRSKLSPYTAEFTDTIATTTPDSSASFFVIAHHLILATPIQTLTQKITQYTDANFSVRERTISKVLIEEPGLFSRIWDALPFVALIDGILFVAYLLLA